MGREIQGKSPCGGANPGGSPSLALAPLGFTGGQMGKSGSILNHGFRVTPTSDLVWTGGLLNTYPNPETTYYFGRRVGDHVSSSFRAHNRKGGGASAMDPPDPWNRLRERFRLRDY